MNQFLEHDPEEELISIADNILFAHTDKYLEDIQRMILRESLAGKSYEEMKDYSSSHIKTKGSQLWELLSTALGEEVSKTSFRAALERRLESYEGAPAALSLKLGKVEIEALKAIGRFESKNPHQPPQLPVDYSVDDLTTVLEIDWGEANEILKRLRRLGLVESIWDNFLLFPNLDRPVNETQAGRLSKAGQDFLRWISNSSVM